MDELRVEVAALRAGYPINEAEGIAAVVVQRHLTDQAVLDLYGLKVDGGDYQVPRLRRVGGSHQWDAR